MCEDRVKSRRSWADISPSIKPESRCRRPNRAGLRNRVHRMDAGWSPEAFRSTCEDYFSAKTSSLSQSSSTVTFDDGKRGLDSSSSHPDVAPLWTIATGERNMVQF